MKTFGLGRDPSSDATVRRATAADAVVLHLLAAATFPLACSAQTPQADIDELIESQLSVPKFREYLADEARTVFIAEYSGTPAGYSIVRFHTPGDAEVSVMLTAQPSAELSKFYLLAGRHGTGLADRLMSVSLDEARDEGMAAVWLGVQTHNVRANAFYDRHRFARRGENMFYVGSHGSPNLIRERAL